MDKKIYKLVILGDSSVGKSCIASRLVNKDFYDFQEPTIGASFLTKKINIDNKEIRFELWDTAGQERYRALAPMYYRNSMAALIVFDITSIDSFNGSKLWINEIIKNRGTECIIYLIGNKADLHIKRKVNKEDAINYSNKNNCIYLETSAKSNIGINGLLTKISIKLKDSKITKLKDSKITNRNCIIINNTREINDRDRNYYNCCY